MLFIGAAAAKAVNGNAAVGASAKNDPAHAWHIIIEYDDFLPDLIYKSKSMSNSIIFLKKAATQYQLYLSLWPPYLFSLLPAVEISSDGGQHAL